MTWRVARAGAGGAVIAVGALAALLLFGLQPARPAAQLLWYEGRPAVATPDGAVVLDGTGNALRVTPLGVERLSLDLGGREPASLARDGTGRTWVATRTGEIVVLDAAGVLVDSVVAPYSYSWVASGPGGAVWAFQSPEQFSFPFGVPIPPLVSALAGAPPPSVPGRTPSVPVMADLVNAGRVLAAPDGGFIYAPFIRDAVMRFGPGGDTVWVTTRGLTHAVDDPTLGLDSTGRPELDYAPVNLGLQWGPDTMLYVVSTVGQTVAVSRLDRLDPETGRVISTTELPTALPTVAVQLDGTVEVLDPIALQTGVPAADRPVFRPFTLAGLAGDTIRSETLLGQITLINFWASWCGPCREEMPELEAVWHELADSGLAFVAVSDDVRESSARRFVEEYGFAFPVALGQGRMQRRYHYFGLPHTMLLDREGRIIYQWSGYGGPPQMESLRTMIRAELDRSPPPEAPAAPHHH